MRLLPPVVKVLASSTKGAIDEPYELSRVVASWN
jgi:hypothetical protein